MIIANIGADMLKWEHKFAPRKMRSYIMEERREIVQLLETLDEIQLRIVLSFIKTLVS